LGLLFTNIHPHTGMGFTDGVFSYKDSTPMVLRKKVFISYMISMKRFE